MKKEMVANRLLDSNQSWCLDLQTQLKSFLLFLYSNLMTNSANKEKKTGVVKHK